MLLSTLKSRHFERENTCGRSVAGRVYASVTAKFGSSFFPRVQVLHSGFQRAKSLGVHVIGLCVLITFVDEPCRFDQHLVGTPKVGTKLCLGLGLRGAIRMHLPRPSGTVV